MTDPTIPEIRQAIADQIQTTLAGTTTPAIEGLQVSANLLPDPSSPPSIDIYEADPFTESLGYGPGNSAFFFTIRARSNTPNTEGAHDLISSMMDPRPGVTTSIVQAILSDDTLGGKVEQISIVDGQSSGLQEFPSTEGNLLGCTWRVEVIP